MKRTAGGMRAACQIVSPLLRECGKRDTTHDALVGEEEDGRHALVVRYDLAGRSQYLVWLQLVELDESRNGHYPHAVLLVHRSGALTAQTPFSRHPRCDRRQPLRGETRETPRGVALETPRGGAPLHAARWWSSLLGDLWRSCSCHVMVGL